MKAAKRNWKTTVAGIFVLALTGWNASQNPKAIQSPEGQAQLITGMSVGLGLVAAKDSD